MKTSLLYICLFFIISIQNFAQDDVGTGVVRTDSNNMDNSKKTEIIEDIIRLKYENDSIEKLSQKKQEQIRLLNEQKELMEQKVHKQKMYFLISALVILLVVVVIFISLIIIVRKSQKN